MRAPLPGLQVSGSRVPPGEVLQLDLTLEAVEGGIVAKGTAVAPWVGECRRCLVPVAGVAEAVVDELFASEPEEGETYPIQVTTSISNRWRREAVVLALPLAPLCRPDCAGLCPTCGADLNAGECSCPRGEVDPRWAALDALRPEP